MARGGYRPGSGPKPKQSSGSAVPPRKPQPLHIPERVLDMLKAGGTSQPTRESSPHLNPFRVENFHPACVVPTDKKLRAHEKMAMDEAITWASNDWAAGGMLQAVAAQGLLFPGYPFLSELAQRPEYDAFSDIIATEMTRKWIKFRGRSAQKGKPDEKGDKIQELESFMDDLDVRGAYQVYAKFDGLMGRAHLFHEIDDNDGMDRNPAAVQELATPISRGPGQIDPSKVNKQKRLTRLRNVEAVWVYPTTYNANNPLAEDFYNPQIWYTIGGRQMHVSRMPCLIGRPVPDLLKPAYSFGGLSLSQLAMPYVDIWLNTREAIGRLVKAFSTPVLSTVLQNLLAVGGAEMMRRADLFNRVRDNFAVFMLDKATETFETVNVPLSGLSDLQAQAQEHMASVSRIPTAVLLGITPTGLNASSEGEIRIFEACIHAYQEARFRKKLNHTIAMCMHSIWGAVDEDIVFDFVPLREMSEHEVAEINKLKAETDDLLVNGVQAIGPPEVRVRVAGDPDSGYDNIDPDEEPELPEPDPLEEAKLSLSGHAAAGAGPGAKKQEAGAKPKPKKKPAGAQDMASG